MRGGALPAAIAFAALALLLGFLPRRVAMTGAAIALGVALIVGAAPAAAWIKESAFLGCWASALIIAACVYLPRPPSAPFTYLLAGGAGLSAGLVVAAEGSEFDVVKAAPALLLAIPASWAVRRGYGLAPRVVASWLIAVALLAATIPYVVTHPGYVPDHRE